MAQTDSELLHSNLCLSPGDSLGFHHVTQCIGPKSSSDADADAADAATFGVYALDAGVDGYFDADAVCVYAFDAGVDGYSDAGAVCVYAFGADADDADADAFCVYAFDAGIGVYSGADVVDADAGADVFVYICIGKLRQKVSYLSLHLKGLLTAVESLHL